MADKNLLSQMLESLVNDEQAKAEELFHEYVVAKSREIYESLIESEMEDDEEVDEATEEEDEEAVEEGMEVTFTETDDEEDTVDFGGDATDDLAGELGGDDMGGDDMGGDDMGMEPAEEGEEELFQDLSDIVDQLQAKFDELKGMEGEEHGADFGDEEGAEDDEEGAEDDEEKEEGFDLETVREYVEKVGTDWDKNGLRKEGEYSGTGAHSDSVNVNSKSIVAGKNDMGGTASNIAQGGTEKSPVEANKGELKGSGLLKGKPQDMNTGNVNVPGGNAGKTGFKTKQPGHGAEKKGEGEGKYSGTGSHSDSVNVTKTSLFRGRR